MAPLEGSQPSVGRETDFGADIRLPTAVAQAANGPGSSGLLGSESLELISQLSVLTL